MILTDEANMDTTHGTGVPETWPVDGVFDGAGNFFVFADCFTELEDAPLKLNIESALTRLCGVQITLQDHCEMSAGNPAKDARFLLDSDSE